LSALSLPSLIYFDDTCLFPKFSYQVIQHEVDFHTPCLKARMANWEGEDLFSLSPLTSPESSPTMTPIMKVAELPAEESDIFQAAEPLPETAQERLKRRRKAQGRNNWAKRQCLTKLEARDGPPVRAKADEKYATSAAKVFTSTSATEFDVASTGYVGLNRCTVPKREYSLVELRKMGFDALKWDGRWARCRLLWYLT
jgi:hypothetical protein